MALPSVTGSASARCGRCAPLKELELSACVTFSGKPLSNVAIIENVQPPASRSAIPPVAQRFPAPNGSSTIGASTTRCGMSRRLRLYSASRS